MQIGAWSLALLAAGLAVLVWGDNAGWQLLPFNSYLWFPVLGLVAFSIMWSHYINGMVRELLGVAPEALKSYYRWTGYAVLGLICLHPGLLIWQRWRDGAGLPPGSYESYVASGLGWITILGTACLLVFLAFELHRWFGKQPWFRYVIDASDVAMLGIVYHGLRLGSNLQQGWFHYVWWFYTITLVLVLIRKYYLRLTTKKARG